MLVKLCPYVSRLEHLAVGQSLNVPDAIADKADNLANRLRRKNQRWTKRRLHLRNAPYAARVYRFTRLA
jgi:hypothetical protein